MLFPNNDITFHLTRTDFELRGSTRTLRGAVPGAAHRKQEGNTERKEEKKERRALF